MLSFILIYREVSSCATVNLPDDLIPPRSSTQLLGQLLSPCLLPLYLYVGF